MTWLRLRQVALVAATLDPIVEDLRAVFGLAVGHRDPGVASFGLENALLPIGTQLLEVVAPTREGTAGGRHLERRGGDGGYMVICQCDDHPPRRRRAVDELGIRTVLEFSDEHYTCMQLHPSDTGGAFLEIDFQADTSEGGDWWPAGQSGEWRSAIRTDVIDAITAVEVQAADPDRVAARWSEIVELDVVDRTITLDNARVDFVEATDGRGDGLGGMTVRAVDRERAMAAATARGLPVDDDVITLCGTRFRLA
jgi:hypothetical protein